MRNKNNKLIYIAIAKISSSYIETRGAEWTQIATDLPPVVDTWRIMLRHNDSF